MSCPTLNTWYVCVCVCVALVVFLSFAVFFLCLSLLIRSPAKRAWERSSIFAYHAHYLCICCATLPKDTSSSTQMDERAFPSLCKRKKEARYSPLTFFSFSFCGLLKTSSKTVVKLRILFPYYWLVFVISFQLCVL